GGGGGAGGEGGVGVGEGGGGAPSGGRRRSARAPPPPTHRAPPLAVRTSLRYGTAVRSPAQSLRVAVSRSGGAFKSCFVAGILAQTGVVVPKPETSPPGRLDRLARNRIR